MKEETGFLTTPGIQTRPWILQLTVLKKIAIALGLGIILFLSLYHLTGYPVSWFDEGSHLHVPKTLIRFGVYADYSSEGFRYYGPTVGVGPTVFLPIAAVFKVFGIGLAQARFVIVLYSLASIFLFYRLGKVIGTGSFALIATAVLVTSRGIAFLDYGREVLGEVPGFFFIVLGFLVWFTCWKKPTWSRLILAGLFFGLSMVTKNQNLLVLGPSLLLAWVANLLYYRTTPQKVFLAPGIVAGACFAVWNIYMVLYLGPATAKDNFNMLRQATQGAALVFSPSLMKHAVAQLLSPTVFLSMLFPVLAYGLYLSLPRTQEGQRWGTLLILTVFNLAWFVFASISWLRYAFIALAVSSLFVSRFFYDLTNGFELNIGGLLQSIKTRKLIQPGHAVKVVLSVWLALMIGLPFAQTAKSIVFPPLNAPQLMADYLNQHIPKNVVIETWEPEMGFLTDHNYHFPPPDLLNIADSYIWLGKASPRQSYHYVEINHPPYILVGAFSTWVQLYPTEILSVRYHLITSIGGYSLYGLNPGL
jgi:4-amino-4-deoxy-L-arabinose transferase-like glycosyltransferase